MHLPFELSTDPETMSALRVGDIIPSTNLRVHRVLQNDPCMIVYAAVAIGTDDYYLCEHLNIDDSALREAVATNALMCRGRTKSPNIANIIEACWLEDGSYLQVLDVTPRARRWQEVHADRILSKDELLTAASQLIPGLQYLHRTGLVHAAISEDAVIIEGNQARLDGFWWAHDSRGEFFDQRAANFYPSKLSQSSKLAMAPEVRAGGQPSRESDVYSLGATFYFALTGEYPQDAAQSAQLAAQRQDMPPSAIRAIQLMLHADPDQRNIFAIADILAPVHEVDEPEHFPEFEEV